MTRPHRYGLGIGTVVTATIVVLTFGWPGLRLAAALALCLLLPGLGWARRIKPSDRGDTLALAVVLSLCATVVVSTTMVLADRWSWTLGVDCLLGIAVLGFLPARRLLSGLGLRTRWRLSADGLGFDDWHAAYVARRRLRAEARKSRVVEWTDWYADQWLDDEAATPADDDRTAVLSLPPANGADGSADAADKPEESG